MSQKISEMTKIPTLLGTTKIPTGETGPGGNYATDPDQILALFGGASWPLTGSATLTGNVSILGAGMALNLGTSGSLLGAVNIWASTFTFNNDVTIASNDRILTFQKLAAFSNNLELRVDVPIGSTSNGMFFRGFNNTRHTVNAGFNLMRYIGGIDITANSQTYRQHYNTPVIDAGGTGTWTFIFSDYDPTLTAVTGLAAHYGLLIRPAACLNGFGLAAGLPTAVMHIAASTTARASLRIPDGTAPTSPNQGDIWSEAGTIKYYDGAVTKTIAFV